ncbi:4-hydroxy-tetrahydrodipicolinate reductase [Proteinivorax tanatarense]|uniref:4-hydroxy-tetrahydrodipicolinate reductase n=1 Tax=Proteinivorax tanatarense TaxID=1260629 RepID=A0AAU7VPL6_9FIRM
MINTAIYGANGKMGQVLSKKIAQNPNFSAACGVDKNPEKYQNNFPVYENPYSYKGELDLIIDFSHPSNLEQMLEFAKKRKVPTVIATTGYSEQQIASIKEASSEIPVLYSPNMSLGVNIVNTILNQYSKLLNDAHDIEIIEKHHNKKIDAPSGTALLFANTINEALDNSKEFNYGREGKNCPRNDKEIGIHTVRGGAISGEHNIIFAGDHEVIEIKHTALSKDVFALDALKAGQTIVNMPVGFYAMQDIFNL